MTISTTASRISYNGNGVTTVFSFPYRFLANGDLYVVEVNAAGVETVKTLTTHYTLTGAGDEHGGSVTMLIAPITGTRLVIYRELVITQETDYVTGDPFPAETHETALDRLTMICQQLSDSEGRSLSLSIGAPSGTDTELPTPESSTLLGWNTDADALRNYSFAEINLAVAAASLLDNKGDLAVGAGGGNSPVALPVGTDGYALVADSTEPYGVKWAPSGLDGTGLVIQTVSTQVGTLASGTTQTPVDNTKPQITEGTQFLSLVFTPMSNTSVLIVDLEALASHSASSGTLTMALHQVGSADAIAATAVGFTAAFQQTNPRLHSYFNSNVLGTGVRTYTMRIGANLAGTTYLNGAGATQYYANVASTRMTITEIEPV